MPTNEETLVEMGFPLNQVQRALSKTGYKSVQLAMDWLFAHADDADINDPFDAPKGHVLTEEGANTSASGGGTEESPPKEGGEDAAALEAKSLKCNECGKLLKSELEAQAHAARTQHTDFAESTEEIKPLTEEERKEQMAQLQEKLKQKRLEKEELEKKENIAKEKMRRHTGRDMGLAKQKHEEMEMKKIAEERRREKREEQLARQKVKEQIEKDKIARAAKFGSQKQDNVSSPAPAQPPAAAAAAAPSAPKEYTECRLQIRLTNGQALTQTFGAKEPLSAVKLYVELSRTDGAAPFSLMTTFPRKVYTSGDMDKPLDVLGLVPSAVIMVTKQQ